MSSTTAFAVETRHYCRNPRCRSKLPKPVANTREAFCARGCHSSFYRHRCLVCERQMERKTENQLICGKRKCRNALQARIDLGRYIGPSASVSPLETSIKPLVETAPPDGRAWRIVTAPELTAEQFRCAIVGAEEAVASINRTNARHRREYNTKAEGWRRIKRHNPPVNVLGGYRFPGARVIDLSPLVTEPIQTDRPVALLIPDDLSIPEFLKR